MADAGLTSVAVTAYPNLIASDPAARRRSVAEIRSHVDLAADLGAGLVRVFVGIRDDMASDEVLAGRAVDGLLVALDHARDPGVGLAIEPHDDHVRAESIRPILAAIPDPLLGVAWDIANAWSVGEDPDEGILTFAGRIQYVQVKDGVGRDGDWRLCALGDGDVPVERALRTLLTSTRDGSVPPISLEWERAWHPELAPAEVALPAARSWLADCLDGIS
jgi:sugar phosphate isomerase/epimerase